ncbi:hypothetical protein [Leptospira jelokensis]|uniref:hypothetical protein n=1 Tax=Leptospira jelokensis TaxID=2484931 RepID=UPI0010911AD5|nr:hypothetical protein [Leptospira jelokensis]TGM07019.1 hypothetical protein EHQ79_00145 [Leptospira jelokensis]
MTLIPIFIFFLLYFFINPYFLFITFIYKTNGIACIFGHSNAGLFLISSIFLSIIINSWVLLKAYKYFTIDITKKNIPKILFIIYGFIYSWFLLLGVMISDGEISCKYDYKVEKKLLKTFKEPFSSNFKNPEELGLELSNYCNSVSGIVPELNDVKSDQFKNFLSEKGEIFLLIEPESKKTKFYSIDNSQFTLEMNSKNRNSYYFCILKYK